MKIFLKIVLFVCWMLEPVLHAAPLAIQTDPVEGALVGKHLLLLEDQEGLLTVDDVAALPNSAFTPSQTEVPNFGFTKSVYWARLELSNPSDHMLPLIMEYDYPMADYVDFYSLKAEGSWQKLESGDRRPASKRPIRHIVPAFPYELYPGKSSIHFRIQNPGVVQIPIKIWQPLAFHNHRMHEIGILLCMAGSLIVMLFYNLFVSIKTKDKASYLYVAYLFFSMSFVMSGQTGLITLTDFDGLTMFLMNAGSLYGLNFGVFFATSLCMKFLEITRDSRLSFYLLRFVKFSVCPLLLVSAIDYAIGIRITTLAVIACVLTLVVASVQRSLQSYRPAYFFGLAWSSFILGTFIYTLVSAGLLPSSSFWKYAPGFGMVMEVILISLAIGDKMRSQIVLALTENERINAKLVSMNENLEQNVTEKTLELKNKNQDLLEQKQLIEQAHAELTKMDDIKTSFFRQVSHELRTPLTLILGSLNLLEKDNRSSDESRSALRNGRRLLRLVNQLLDFQKLQQQGREAGRPIDMRVLIMAVGEAFMDACRGRDIHLHIDDLCDKHTTPWVLGKVDGLEKILFNYLSNALKYSPNGGRIGLILEVREGQVRVTVEDSGPGIDPEQQKNLFQVFGRLQDSDGRWREGTGIGLALCKELTLSMQGQIGVSSRVNMGSSFWVSFPLSAGDVQARQQQLMDLLFVDDEPIAQRDFARALALHAELEKTMIVGSFEEAEQLLRSHRFRCIVTDINLGSKGGNGIDLLILAAQLYPDSIRVIISADKSGDKLQLAINSARVSSVIFKPIQWQDELPRLEALIRKSPMQAELDLAQENIHERSALYLADQEPAAVSNEQEVDASPSEGATILVTDDLLELRILIKRMLGHDKYRFLEAADGAEALKILRSDASIDLLLVDWMMPVMTGVELIQAIREDVSLQSLPVVLLTAKGDEVSRHAALNYGANAYVAKPFDELELASTVGNLLSLKSKEKELIIMHRHMTEHVLQRFLPAGLVQKILDGTSSFDEAPQTRTITIMFVDLCNFTSLTERLGPQRISRILNTFLSSMSQVIFDHGGTIEKFIGDGILVLFGAPENLTAHEQTRRAKDCAIQMMNALDQLNQTWQKEQLPVFQMRIGIHHGPAVVGSFGGPRRSDYTVIGSTVNLAARIQTAAEPNSIFISAVVRDFLDDKDWEDAGIFEIKGVEAKQHLYRIVVRQVTQAA